MEATMKDCLGTSGEGWSLRECPAVSAWTFQRPSPSLEEG